MATVIAAMIAVVVPDSMPTVVAVGVGAALIVAVTALIAVIAVMLVMPDSMPTVVAVVVAAALIVAATAVITVMVAADVAAVIASTMAFAVTLFSGC